MKSLEPIEGVMDAVVCDGAGDVSVMSLQRIQRPAMPPAGSGHVLLRVHAAGVNRPDLLQRAGVYAPPADASQILGLEVAGEVVGGDVGDAWALGDAVCALTHGGGYAEYVVVERAQCLPVPRGWSMVAAASLPETYFTVWLNVFDRAHFGRDGIETLLVHAGASGIGVAAIQLARAMGQNVWASAGSAEKRAACLALGAQGVFDYHSNDWAAEFLAECPAGADVVLDVLGADMVSRNLSVMAQGARLAWIAFLTGNRAQLNISDVMAREITLTGAFLRRQSNEVKARIAADLRQRVWPLMDGAAIVPVVNRVFDFADVRAAHEYMASNVHIGKIVLQLHK